MHVAVIWEEAADLWRLPGLFEYAGDAQILVLRAIEHLDVVALDAASKLDMEWGTYYLRLPVTMSLRK